MSAFLKALEPTMTLTCSKCSRINPEDAIYCYFDGIALSGAGGGPVSVGSQPFVTPFVFSNGRSCRSFDELAMACQEDWKGATEALTKGYLGAFFGGIGRADLAQVAQKAADFPDPARGLDQLIAELPTKVLEEPRLQISSRELNLGQLSVGDDRDLEIELENQGMRLLYGTATCEAPWLSLGEGAGVAEKHFQFEDQGKLTIHINGEKLRAGNKPLEGTIELSSNGGSETIVVRAQVPILPFPDGPLEGAKTPRKIAEKAKENPKLAARLFESGAVAQWYKSNGWIYPVQGPSASGLGAVQQFFEALGLTPPPKVSINQQEIELSGSPGEEISHVLEVRTREKRPVYAHGTSNQPWVEVRRARLAGRVAQIAISITSVPNRPGETLTAKVTIQSNGNQRFVVPITLHIAHSLDFFSDDPAPVAPQPVVEVPQVVEEPAALVPQVVEEAAGEVVELPEEEGIVAAPSPVTPSVPAPLPATPVRVEEPSPSPSIARRRRQAATPVWVHGLPAALLGLILLVLLVVDLVSEKKQKVSPKIARDPGSGAYLLPGLRNPKRPLGVYFSPDSRFGLVMLGQKDPNNPELLKRLTFDREGSNNSTIIKVDGFEHFFGKPPGKWVRERTGDLNVKKNLYGRIATMEWPQQKVQASQLVQLLPSRAGALDTCLVLYRVQNRDTQAAHRIGIRVLMDTYIGANDGVPFLIPGEEDFVTTLKTLTGSDIPAYVEAIENPDDPANPGTTVRVGLQGIQLPETPLLEPLDKVVICGYPGNVRWDWKYGSMRRGRGPRATRDSCVALYWKYEEIPPGEVRYYGFTYGLSDLDFSGSKNLVLSVPNNVYAGKDFVATAYVYNARANQSVTIELPPGFQLAAGEKATKTIPKATKRTTVFWKLIAPDEKKHYEMRIRSLGSGAVITVEVKGDSIFG